MKDKTQLQIARDKVRSIINEYKRYISETNEIEQSLTSNYQSAVVQGGYKDGQALQRKIEDKVDKDRYIESVESILRKLPSTYRKIIIERYYRKTEHDYIIELLAIDEDDDIARTTYFRWYDNAVMTFYNESIARMVEMRIK